MFKSIFKEDSNFKAMNVDSLRIPFLPVTADLGFNTSKFIFEGDRYRDLPSLIATYDKPIGDDGLSSPTGSIWDWLKVQVYSPAIDKKLAGKGIAIGKAAYGFDSTHDPQPYGNKYKDDNHTVILLASIAADALEHGAAYHSGEVKQKDATGTERKYQKYEVKAFLSTFLPMREFKDIAKRESFIKKFTTGVHRVQFFNTVSSHSDKIVEIMFLDHVELNPEGLGNHVRLKFNMDGSETDNHYVNNIHVIGDLGGGTLDEAYMRGSYCDPDKSEGRDIGVNELLKIIRKEIETSEKFRRFKFSNLSEVNDMILAGLGITKKSIADLDENYLFVNKKQENLLQKSMQHLKNEFSKKLPQQEVGKYFISWYGEPHDVTPIVEKELTKFCEFRLFPIIRDRLIHSPEVVAYTLSGGTAVLVQEELTKINNELEKAFPIYFTDRHTSYWGLVEAGDILGATYRAENNLLLPEEMEED
ncbi:hypothetical protein J2Z48_002931 [Croceifilum oryzae]|uniref:Actin-like protein N-terminal domain-containing protein n=1 Tax=Croceifilum oryzae TaxID=1553429 RepID=A0AAJ1TLI7_9BACL|nr:hypothetical protein [Croceifilum oryzae]MDQ0418727.1 hypothetical protein [Croceifilum oryzae]